MPYVYPDSTIVEFQIKASVLLALFRARLTQQAIPLTGRFTFNNLTYLVDHLEVGDSSLRQSQPADSGHSIWWFDTYGQHETSIPTTALQIAQDVTAFIVAEEDLSAPNPQLTPLQVTVVLNVAIQVQPTSTSEQYMGDPYLSISFSDIELSAAVQQLLNQSGAVFPPDVRQSIANAVNTSPTPLTIAEAIYNVNDGTLAIYNAGIVASADLDRVAIRIEINEATIGPGQKYAATVGFWTDFYAGELADLVDQNDWGLFVFHCILEDQVRDLMYDAVAQSGSNSVAIQGGVPTEWETPNGSAQISANFTGQYYISCGSIAFQVALRLDFTVPTSNTLETDIYVAINPDTGDSNGCGVVASAVISVVLAVFAAGPVVDDLALDAAASSRATSALTGSPGGSSTTSCTVDSQPGGEHLACASTLNLNKSAQDSAFGTMTLQNASGRPDGLQLNGTVERLAALNTAVLATQVEPWTFSGTIYFHCEAGPTTEQQRADAVQGYAYVVLSNQAPIPQAPLHVWAVSLLETSLAVLLNLITVTFDDESVSLMLDLAGALQAGLTETGECRLLIQSSGGAREVTVPSASLPTVAEASQLCKIDTIEDFSCAAIVDPWWWYFHRYNPVWSVDPGPGDPETQEVLHQWNVSIVGLAAGSPIILQTGSGETLAEATVPATEVLQLGAIVPPALNGVDISLVRPGALGAVGAMIPDFLRTTGRGRRRWSTVTGPGGQPLPAVRVDTKQALLVQRATLSFQMPCLALFACLVQGLPALGTVSASSVHVFDLSMPRFPRLLWSHSVPGVRGATTWRDVVVAWGDAGLLAMEGGTGTSSRPGGVQLGRFCPPPRERQKPIRDGIVYGDFGYFLTEDSLEIFDRTMAQVGRVAVDGGTHLTASRDALFIATERQVLRYGLAQKTPPARTGEYPVSQVAGLVSTGPRDAIFVLSPTGAGDVLDLSKAGIARPLVRYKRAAWFTGYVRVGRLAVRVSSDGRDVSIYDASRTTLI